MRKNTISVDSRPACVVFQTHRFRDRRTGCHNGRGAGGGAEDNLIVGRRGFALGGQIITIDSTTGAGTFLADQQLSSSIVLAAATPSVPEPSVLTLLAACIIAIAASRFWAA